MFSRSLILPLLLMAAGQVSALEIAVDGKLDDWLAPPSGAASDWTNTLDGGIKLWVDDDTGKSGYLNPGYGGQTYDAEAIYVYKSKNSIDIAIVTGLSPNTPIDAYPAGDIAIDFGFVLGDPDYKPSFDIGVVTLGDGVGIGSAGDVYQVSEWNYGLWTAPGVLGNTVNDFKKKHPTTIANGSKIGNVEFAYSQTAVTGIGEYVNDEHYVIEASIPLSLLTGYVDTTQSFLAHWTMACANDFVEVDPPGVPTPAPLGLMLLGLLALFRHRVSGT